MKKYLLFAITLFFFVFINHNFASETIPPFKPGKITPFKWDKGIDIIDLVNACPFEDIDPNQSKPTVSNMVGVFRIIRTDGREEFYDNRHGQSKSPAELKDGDQIKTYDGSSSINFSDGSSWVLGNNTTIKYRNAEAITKVSLLFGRLRIILPSIFLKPLKNKITAKLEAKMKTAAACVRGTDFVMEQTEDENVSKYYLYEGNLDVANLNGEIQKLQPGNIAVIDSDGQTVLEKMSDNSWNELVGQLVSIGSIKSDMKEENINESSWIKRNSVFVFLFGFFGYYIYRKRLR